jgi:hypothetical protein
MKVKSVSLKCGCCLEEGLLSFREVLNSEGSLVLVLKVSEPEKELLLQIQFDLSEPAPDVASPKT